MELGSNWKQPHKSTASEIENGHDPTLSQSPRGLLVDIATRQKTLLLRFSKEPFPVDRRLMVRIDRYSSYTSKTFLDVYHVYLLAKLEHSHSVTKRTCGKPSPGGPVDQPGICRLQHQVSPYTVGLRVEPVDLSAALVSCQNSGSTIPDGSQ